MATLKRLRLVFRGRVQGVGFRYHTASLARAHGLTGWVRNRRDATVVAELQGPIEPLQRCLRAAQEGPPLARFTRLDRTDIPPHDTDTDFQIRP